MLFYSLIDLDERIMESLYKFRIFLNQIGYEGDLYDIFFWICSFRIYPLFLFSHFAELSFSLLDFFDPSIFLSVFLLICLLQISCIFWFSEFLFFFKYINIVELFILLFYFPLFSTFILTYKSDIIFEILNFDFFNYALLTLTSFLFFNIFQFIDFSKYIYIRVKIFILCFSKLVLFITFSVSNIFHFYVFFEIILLPFFFLISIWGSRLNRIWSAQRLLFFTLFFSTPMFIFLLSFIFQTSSFFSFNFFDFYYYFAYYAQDSMFSILFFLSFSFFLGVKVPLFPIHIWLPEAHGEAPTIGSILLAGLLLKLGAYGFYRFSYFLPGLNAYDDIFFFIYFLSIFSIFSSNFSVFAQLDFKKIIAYFSIGHMAYVVVGFLLFNPFIALGSFVITISHGLSSAVLFFLIGFLYDQTHSRSLNNYSALATKTPIFSVYLFFALLANMSFPGTAGFVGEQLVFFGLSFFSPFFLIFPIFFTIFSGFATVLFILRLLFGNSTQPFTCSLHDITRNDQFFALFCLAPIFFFGLFPGLFL